MPASVVDPDMALLTNGLEILDKFKKPDNDHESDEESFHLLSDGEDDSDKTSNICTELGEALKDETEDEILKKLDDSSSLKETANVPDIDEKLEQKLLEDGEDLADADAGDLATLDEVNAEDMGNFKSKTNTNEECDAPIVSEIENLDKVDNSTTENTNENDAKSIPDNTDTENPETENTKTKNTETENTETENTESNNSTPDKEKENQLMGISNSSETDILADIDDHDESKTNSEENKEKEEDLLMEEVNRNLEDDGNETGEKSEMEEKELMEVDESVSSPKDKDIDEHLLDESELCDMQSDATDDKIEQSEGHNERSESETSHAETELQKLLDKADEVKLDDIVQIKNEVDEEKICNVESVVHVEEDNQEEADAPKSPNLESDDLLDISIIRDADEDDAHLAECSNDATSIEKDENDETSDERMDEVEDEDIDMAESEKPSESGDNDEQMDDVSENDKDNENDVNSDSKDEAGSEAQTEMETDAADDILKKIDDAFSKPDEDDKSVGGGSEEVGNDGAGNIDEPAESREAVDSGIPTPTVDDDDEASRTTSIISEASTVPLDPDPVSKKRPSSTADANEETPSKKIKLTPEELKEKQRIKSLISFAQYMKQQSLKRLTRSDLEEFCVQKITEVIVHRSELGEINQQLRQQEQMVETLRKDQQQLSKQVRDLEIVNKKLMTELRVNSGIKKPLVPLKITRSVGLQVKLQPQGDSMAAAKRRVIPQNQKGPASSGSPMVTNSTNNNANMSRVVQRQSTTATPTRPTAQSPQKTMSTAPIGTPPAPNRRSQPNTPIKTTIQQRPKPPEGKSNASQSVIDLTDEDDKKSDNNKKNENNKKGAESALIKKTVTNTTPNRTIATLGPGVRLATPTQVKSTPITGVVNNTGCGPQLMYVLPPGTQLPSGVLTSGAQKAVLLNFQSNGILAPTSNGSSVSVIPKSTANIQSIQTKTVKASKHPAPLPNPPPVRFTGSGTHKPIPPKPFLCIKKTDTGIILQWRMPYDLSSYENIASYQLYAYQETNSPPSTDMWRRVGDVKALALPMACTLTQFADKNKYYFAVRAVDVCKRIGAFSDPEEISL